MIGDGLWLFWWQYSTFKEKLLVDLKCKGYNNDEEIYKYWRYKLKSTEFNFIINSSNLFHSFLSNFFSNIQTFIKY